MPSNPRLKSKGHSPAPYILLAAVLFVFIETYALLAPILLSFLLILLISLAANPLISRMRSFLTGGRTIATGLAATALVVILVLTSWAFFGPIKDSLSGLSEQLPSYWERLQKPLIKMEKQAELSEEKIQKEVSTEIADAAAIAGEHETVRRIKKSAPATPVTKSTSLRSGLSGMLLATASRFTELAFNAAQILLVLVTVFFGVTFTLMNPRPIFGVLFSLVPENHQDQMLAIMRRIGIFVPAWAGATLLGMIIIGLLVFLLMWPILGFMDALVLGLIAGVLEAIPFIGPILSAVPALLLALGKGGMTPVWVVIAYLAIQALENNIILPAIMARGMKLHPVAVIFSMLLCVAAFGVLGVLLAAPMVAIVDIVHDELYRKHYLPSVTNADLDRMARKALHETVAQGK